MLVSNVVDNVTIFHGTITRRIKLHKQTQEIGNEPNSMKNITPLDNVSKIDNFTDNNHNHKQL